MFKQKVIKDVKGMTESFNHPSRVEVVGSDGFTRRKTYEIKLNLHGQFESMTNEDELYRNNIRESKNTEKYTYTYQ